MTKQATDESALKCQVSLEGTDKIGEGVTKMISDDALVICDINVRQRIVGQLKTTQVSTAVNSETGELGKILCVLYNLDGGVESAKPVKIDLDVELYQMETF